MHLKKKVYCTILAEAPKERLAAPKNQTFLLEASRGKNMAQFWLGFSKERTRESIKLSDDFPDDPSLCAKK